MASRLRRHAAYPSRRSAVRPQRFRIPTACACGWAHAWPLTWPTAHRLPCGHANALPHDSAPARWRLSRRHRPRLQQFPHGHCALPDGSAACRRSPARDRAHGRWPGWQRWALQRSASARTGMPGAFWPAHSRRAFATRARASDQHGASAAFAASVFDAGRNRAGSCDRSGQRARGSTPDLSGRGACATAQARPTPAGDRHRRRLDRVHHRPRVSDAGTRESAGRMHCQHAAVFSRAANCPRRSGRMR